MWFVYLYILIFGAWIACNLPATPLPKFDRSLVILGMVASVEAIFLSTFILITQNRISQRAAKRAELDLQIRLLAEHEVTRLITLLKAIAECVGLQIGEEGELSELEKDTAPERVLDLIEKEDSGEPAR